MTYLIFTIVTAVLLLPGVLMALIPGLPGLLYMLTVALIFGAFDHFEHLTLGNLGILALVMTLAMLADLSSGLIGARWGGASTKSLLYGFLGLLVGTVVIPIPVVGSLAGLFLGILVAEWYRTADIKKAEKAAIGGFAGSLVGMAVNVTAAITFVVLFLIFALG
ncbi:MAG: DUF456 domain-containing protein [Candidatus Pacebacteria bacterium]|nr:DUF456 domain-containing protein [Candidatus Paceibacterota bacterium]